MTDWIGHHTHASEPTLWRSGCGRAEVRAVPTPRSAYKWIVVVDDSMLYQRRGGRVRRFKSVEAAKWAAVARMKREIYLSK